MEVGPLARLLVGYASGSKEIQEVVNEALARFHDPESVELVFSAHSVPVAVIEQGDPLHEYLLKEVS